MRVTLAFNGLNEQSNWGKCQLTDVACSCGKIFYIVYLVKVHDWMLSVTAFYKYNQKEM